MCTGSYREPGNLGEVNRDNSHLPLCMLPGNPQTYTSSCAVVKSKELLGVSPGLDVGIRFVMHGCCQDLPLSLLVWPDPCPDPPVFRKRCKICGLLLHRCSLPVFALVATLHSTCCISGPWDTKVNCKSHILSYESDWAIGYTCTMSVLCLHNILTHLPDPFTSSMLHCQGVHLIWKDSQSESKLPCFRTTLERAFSQSKGLLKPLKWKESFGWLAASPPFPSLPVSHCMEPRLPVQF